MALTVDASVWVAAAERSDFFHEPSRRFLIKAAQQRLNIYLPSFAWVEIACALSRKRQDTEGGRKLAAAILNFPRIVSVQMDTPLLAQAVTFGTYSFLRGADALYAAVAAVHSTQLVSWDQELLSRASAVTPDNWLHHQP